MTKTPAQSIRPICRSLLCCLLVGMGYLTNAATAEADERFTGMDQYIRDAMQQWLVPGLAVAIIHDGRVLVARGYGVRDLTTDTPVEVDSVFPIASCTKSFTAAAIALLVDEGKLDWDDAVRKHFPEFRVADDYVTQHVTLRDLLAHRTSTFQTVTASLNRSPPWAF